MTDSTFAGRRRLWSLVLSLVMVAADLVAVPGRATAAPVGTALPDVAINPMPSQGIPAAAYESHS